MTAMLGQKRVLMRWIAGVAAVLVLVAAAGLTAVPAGAAPSGSFSGRVVDVNGVPIPSICVGNDTYTVTTDSNGLYSVSGVEAGAYDVHLSDCGPQPTHYVDQWYLGHPDHASADQVIVTDGVDTPLADVTMQTGVNVSGTVTDTSGNPISDTNVWINPTTPGLPSSGGYTAADGTYTSGALPSGSYTVQFGPSNPAFIGGWWNNKVSQSDADTLVLDTADGPLHSGVDAQLTAAASISGTVTDTNGVPLAGICVEADTPSPGGGWSGVNGTSTAPDGTYTMSGLAAIDVRVQFRDCSTGPHVGEWYADTTDFDSSTPIVLSPGEVRTGIDAQLAAGTSVSGTVLDEGGNPIPNVPVNVDPVDSGPSAWAQTDASGNYTTNALPPGDYRVHFQGTAGFAGEYWDDQLGSDNATVLTITNGEGPVHGGVNATLATGASISGTVTGPTGLPLDHICVDAVVPSGGGFDGVGGTNTASDGTYTISGIPSTAVKVLFRDCNNVGPYVQQWWDGQSSPEAATGITLAAGESRTGVDAQLAAAGAIAGRVTDSGGHPLQNICAQASTATFTGGMAQTDSNGDYVISLAQGGDYHVQFIDCGSGVFAGHWWGGASDPATAGTVHVDTGSLVSGIDATLVPGTTGSISGRVTNVRGAAMTAACVIAYAPYQLVRFGAVQPDGTYTIPDVPSGTYAIAFLGCGSGDPVPVVPDPDVPGVVYGGFWYDAVPLSLTMSTDGGPDPIAQGANLVTVTSGADLSGYDGCFGCTSITITSVTPGPNSITVAFTTPDLTGAGASGAGAAAAASLSAALPLTYTVTCSSPGGATGTASGPGSPITVSGLTSGASYTCQVAAWMGGTLVAGSAPSATTVAAGHATNPSAADPSGSDPSDASAGVTGSLPRTGASSPLTLVRAGFLLLLVGGALAVTGRKRRRAVADLG